MSTRSREDFLLKEISPRLGGVRTSGDKLTNNYDLVERMDYLYVKVLRAKDLPMNNLRGTCDPYVEVKLGNHNGMTRHLEKTSTPEWNQVFCFLKDLIQSSDLEVIVKNHDFAGEDFIGRVSLDLSQIQKKVLPDSALVPQWYELRDLKGDGVKGELRLAIWMGTQADEAFSGAWCSDAAVGNYDDLENVRSKVYISPKLWYLRVNVIQAQDLIPTDKNTVPQLFGKVVFGNQALRTRELKNKNLIPVWNEEMMFVAAEPSEEPLILSVEDRVAPNKVEVLGKCVIPLQMVDRRLGRKPLVSRWYKLTKYVPVDGDKKKEEKNTGRISVKICLEGGYHVIDEPTHYNSDFRPTAKQLQKPSIGVLELGILGASQLLPMKTKDGRGKTDAYCVAKYAQKWARTRTIVNSLDPRWNDQYSWEVFDPCTVITIGVFDNGRLQEGGQSDGGKDAIMGKVRIRLSTLETGRVYTHSYPLLVLQPSGVKKMGEVQLAVRFARSWSLNMMHLYAQTLLPKMHYILPLAAPQVDSLRRQANQIICMRLGCSKPPLSKQVVEYILDVHSHQRSVRRSKVNFFRVMSVLSGLIALCKWFEDICNWKDPLVTTVIHLFLMLLAAYPGLIIPGIFIYLSLTGWWYYRRRPRHPLYLDTRLSRVDDAHPDELEEEFDTFPTSCPDDILRLRYDRLRTLVGRFEMVVGDLATQGERLQSLLRWRDPRATILFLIFCHVASLVFSLTPFAGWFVITGCYVMRHPRFRHKLPSVPLNFFRRLPTRTDSLL